MATVSGLQRTAVGWVQSSWVRTRLGDSAGRLPGLPLPGTPLRRVRELKSSPKWPIQGKTLIKDLWDRNGREVRKTVSALKELRGENTEQSWDSPSRVFWMKNKKLTEYSSMKLKIPPLHHARICTFLLLALYYFARTKCLVSSSNSQKMKTMEADIGFGFQAGVSEPMSCELPKTAKLNVHMYMLWGMTLEFHQILK